MKERLQKILAHAGVASRRAAEELIREGRVSVDGVVVTVPGTLADPEDERICVDGADIFGEPLVYFLLNKPRGYISSARDDRGRKTVLDLLSGVGERVYPVGRLDVCTEGLLIVTNDGKLTNALLHPRGNIERTYLATVAGDVSDRSIGKLRHGVRLTDGMTLPAKVRRIFFDGKRGLTRLMLTLREGRNREVRRMCEAVGHVVRSLERVSFAGLVLDGVRRGGYRALTEAEVRALYERAGLSRGGANA